MSKTSKRRITTEIAGHVIRHVRDNALDGYGWSIPAVQMGNGKFRKYVPVLVDHDEIVMDDEGHVIFIQKGAVSLIRGLVTRMIQAAMAYEIFAGSPHLERGDKRKFRAIAAILDGVTTMMQDALKKVA